MAASLIKNPLARPTRHPPGGKKGRTASDWQTQQARDMGLYLGGLGVTWLPASKARKGPEKGGKSRYCPCLSFRTSKPIGR